MVSISTVITLGLIGIAAVGFISLGGAAGIGQRIGGGFRAFGESVVSGIQGEIVDRLNPFADQGGDKPVQLPEPTCGTGTKENVFGQCVPIETTVQPSIIPQITPSLFFAPAPITFFPQAFAEPDPVPTRIGPIPSLFFAPAPISTPSPTIGAGQGGFSGPIPR